MGAGIYSKSGSLGMDLRNRFFRNFNRFILADGYWRSVEKGRGGFEYFGTYGVVRFSEQISTSEIEIVRILHRFGDFGPL